MSVHFNNILTFKAMNIFFVLLLIFVFSGCKDPSPFAGDDSDLTDIEALNDSEDGDATEDYDEFCDEPDDELSDFDDTDEELYDPLIDGFRSGQFVIKYKESPLEITIFHNDDPGHIVFSSAKGEDIINARLVTTIYHENAGSFLIEETEHIHCTAHTLEPFSYQYGVIVFHGKFLEEECGVEFKLTFDSDSMYRLGFRIDIEPLNFPENPFALWRASIKYSSSPDENFYGFGEQFTHFNLKGKRLPIIAQEQGIGRGQEPISTIMNNVEKGTSGDWHTSYAPVPHYITNKHRSLFLKNYEYSIFDFQAPSIATVEVDSQSLRGGIIFGNSMLDLIERYTEFSGRMSPLPKWMGNGAIIGMQGGSSSVRSVHEKMKAHNVPLAGYWLQDWVGKRETIIGSRLWWNWELDRKSYPDWEEMVSELNSDGIKVLSYINPFLTDVKNKPSYNKNMFKYATEKGYLLRDHSGQVIMVKMGGFDAAMIDLSNPEAIKWIKNIIKENLIGSGVHGWMADFGESVPYEAVPFSGESASTFHNRYVELWAQINREVIEESGMSGEIAFFNRAGFTRSPAQSTLFWLGDQNVTWDRHDGIKTAVTGLLSSGISGYSLNHSDIGGYLSVDVPLIKFHRSKELLLRWIEMNAFTALFRSHEGNNPGSSHQVYSDDDTVSFFGKFAKIYALLSDYREELMDEAHKKGYPLVRHPMLHYEDDPEVYLIEYQFMLGNQFMIAPVLDEGKNKMTLYLPKGEWIHLWSGETFGNENKGKFITIDSPLGEPPVFYKKGSEHGEKLFYNIKLHEQPFPPIL